MMTLPARFLGFLSVFVLLASAPPPARMMTTR